VVCVCVCVCVCARARDTACVIVRVGQSQCALVLGVAHTSRDTGTLHVYVELIHSCTAAYTGAEYPGKRIRSYTNIIRLYNVHTDT
jgi:hypothetical protein